MKMTLDHQPPTHHQELDVSNISGVTYRIWTKLKSYLFGTILNRCQVSQGHLSFGHMSISAISLLLLNKFLPNFECRFLGPTLLNAIPQGNI